LNDLLGKARYERGAGRTASGGLYLDMPAWGFHAFDTKGSLTMHDVDPRLYATVIPGNDPARERRDQSPPHVVVDTFKA
jgi:hypothetical protein